MSLKSPESLLNSLLMKSSIMSTGLDRQTLHAILAEVHKSLTPENSAFIRRFKNDPTDGSRMLCEVGIDEQVWVLKILTEQGLPKTEAWIFWDSSDTEGDCVVSETYECHLECMVKRFYERVFAHYEMLQSIAANEGKPKAKSAWSNG